MVVVQEKEKEVEFKYIVNSKNYYCGYMRDARKRAINSASKEAWNSSLRDFVFLEENYAYKEVNLMRNE